MAIGWWCLWSRMFVGVVVRVVVRVRMVMSLVVRVVMRVAMGSHLRVGRLTNMKALVGRVFAVLVLRLVICGLQGCLAIVVHNARLRAVGSAANTIALVFSTSSYLPLFHTVNVDKVVDNTADCLSPAQRNALNAALEPTWSRCDRYNYGKHPALRRQQQCPSQHHRHTQREALLERRVRRRKR